MSFESSLEALLFLVAQVSEAVPASAPAGGEGGGPAGPGGSPLGGMLPMLAIFGIIMYLFMIRPQQKKERERQDMLGALSKGDEVITAGGICGKVVGITDNDVVLRVDDDVTIKFLRSSVSHVVKDKDKEEEKK